MKTPKLNAMRMTAKQHTEGIEQIAAMLGRCIYDEALKLYNKLTLHEKQRFEGPRRYGGRITPERNQLAFGRILCAAVLHRLPREVEAESLLRDIKAAKRIERNRP